MKTCPKSSDPCGFQESLLASENSYQAEEECWDYLGRTSNTLTSQRLTAVAAEHFATLA